MRLQARRGVAAPVRPFERFAAEKRRAWRREIESRLQKQFGIALPEQLEWYEAKLTDKMLRRWYDAEREQRGWGR